ncbi:MAG: TIR domain-containing protein [Lewinellaceae bacterium]|nr:TIR domain-containing protein [Lewinellaceae bacterium]
MSIQKKNNYLTINTTEKNAYRGFEIRVELSRVIKCKECQGNGKRVISCPECYGQGTIYKTRKNILFGERRSLEKCSRCKGVKKINLFCYPCDGRGFYYENRPYVIRIPFGSEIGEEIVKEGLGNYEFETDETGDLIVSLEYDIEAQLVEFKEIAKDSYKRGFLNEAIECLIKASEIKKDASIEKQLQKHLDERDKFVQFNKYLSQGMRAYSEKLWEISLSNFEKAKENLSKTSEAHREFIQQKIDICIEECNIIEKLEQAKREFSKGNLKLALDIVSLILKERNHKDAFSLQEKIENYVNSLREPLNFFIAYSRNDEDICITLIKNLKVLQIAKLINNIWYDGLIEAGKNWDEQIKNALKKADIILLLISTDFIASEYCYETEMKTALKLHDDEKVKVIPIIIRECLWQKTHFSYLQALPKDGKPVTSTDWENKDRPFTQITESLEKTIIDWQREKILEKRLDVTS